MEKNREFKDFHEAYQWLYAHPIFQFEYNFGQELKVCWVKFSNEPATGSFFYRAIDIDVVKVNPENDTIDDDKSLNTKTAVWLEIGGEWEEKYNTCQSHYWHLDTGGDTYEEAILSLAELVYKYYKDGSELLIDPTTEDDDE